jgi:hypothetical protein
LSTTGRLRPLGPSASDGRHRRHCEDRGRSGPRGGKSIDLEGGCAAAFAEAIVAELLGAAANRGQFLAQQAGSRW